MQISGNIAPEQNHTIRHGTTLYFEAVPSVRLGRADNARVVIAVPTDIVRAGLRSVIEQRGLGKVVAEARDGYEAVQLAAQARPDMGLVALSLPGVNGVDVTRQVLGILPKFRAILLLPNRDCSGVVEQALSSGVAGCILEGCASEELDLAIHVVLEQRSYVSPAIEEAAGQDGVGCGIACPWGVHMRLTVREREVLRLVAEGKTTKEVGVMLHISAKTVDAHRQEIMNRLGLRTVAELTKYAIREHLTSLNP